MLQFDSKTSLPVFDNKFVVVNGNTQLLAVLDQLIQKVKTGQGRQKIGEYLALEDFKSLKKVVFVWDHGHEHIGFMTVKGLTLENFLEYLSKIKGGVVINEEVPAWLAEIGKALATTINVEWLIKKFITDILTAIRAIHNADIVHFDIKEANIMVFGPEMGAYLPQFVLFDFGSARKCRNVKDVWEIDSQGEHFEVTYNYLPQIIQRRNPLSHFTSHNRVKISIDEIRRQFDKVQVDFFAMDLHALGCIINNILSDERYRRIAALLKYRQFESFFAFAQILSIDFKVYDSDSIYNNAKGKDCVSKAQSLFDKTNTYENAAIRDKGIFFAAGAGLSLANEEFVHPARKLFYEELNIVHANLKGNDNNILNNKGQKTQKSLDESQTQIDTQVIPIREKYEKELLEKMRLLRILLSPEKIKALPPAKKAENNVDFALILETSIFQRLKNIKQLALSHLYPPDDKPYYAQHNRYYHSLGALEIASLYLINISINSGWFRLRYSQKDGVFFLLTAMLHDVGHYYCSHYLEDTEIFNKHSDIIKELLSAQPRNCENFAEDHDIRLLHVGIGKILAEIGATKEEYFEWYQALSTSIIEHAKTDGAPPRLLFRVFQNMISGPIDVDKLHYIVNDSLNCGSSLAASFEGPCYNKLLTSLRIPVRCLEDSGTERFCLGLEEDSSHLAQLLIFIRSSLFNEIYWSSLSRAATVMLRHILFECFVILNECDRGRFVMDFVRGWMHACTDEAWETLLQKLINEAKEACKLAMPGGNGVDRKKYEDYLKSCEMLEEIYLCLVSKGNNDKAYKEVCRIYHADRVCYENIAGQVLPIEIEGKKLIGPTRQLLMKIRDITAETLGLDVERLPDGSILVDIPMQETSKKSEFLSFALVDGKGYGRQPGHVWDAIEDEFREYSRIIRIFIKPGIVQIDREDSVAIRSAIISRLS